MKSKMVNQIPMFVALSATGRRVSQRNFLASKRISTQLFNNANKGASGNAATKMVRKPNCKTVEKYNKLKIYLFVY